MFDYMVTEILRQDREIEDLEIENEQLEKKIDRLEKANYRAMCKLEKLTNLIKKMEEVTK